MDVHGVLVQGRNRLAAGYLVKDMLEDGQGGVCAYGALGMRTDGTARVVAGEALADALGVATIFEVIDFNNAPGTTKADVLALFDRAIAQTAPQPDLSFLADVRVEPEVPAA